MWYVFLIFLISRVLVILSLPITDFLYVYFGWGIDDKTWKGVANPWLNKWTAFDSEYYINMSQRGYYSEETTAFFPLYPTLIKLLSHIGIEPALGGFIISAVSFLLGMIVFAKILKKELGDDKYPLWLIAFSPITVFFMAVYTESLFFLLTVLTFYFISEKKWFLAGIFAGITCLTRNSGLILFVCIFVELWQENKSFFIAIKESLKKLWVGVLIMSVFPIYLWINYGTPIKFASIQSERWNRYFTLPWETVITDIANLINYPHEYFIVVFNFIALIVVVWMFVKWKETRISYLIFIAFVTLMPLLSPPYWNGIPATTGLARYALVLFPVYMFLAKKIKNKLLRIVVLEINIGLLFMLLNAFVNKQFIG